MPPAIRTAVAVPPLELDRAFSPPMSLIPLVNAASHRPPRQRYWCCGAGLAGLQAVALRARRLGCGGAMCSERARRGRQGRRLESLCARFKTSIPPRTRWSRWRADG